MEENEKNRESIVVHSEEDEDNESLQREKDHHIKEWKILICDDKILDFEDIDLKSYLSNSSQNNTIPLQIEKIDIIFCDGFVLKAKDTDNIHLIKQKLFT